MSLVKCNSLQLGQSLTASQNFTWYQPASPDGTVRLGNGNSGSVTDLVTLTSAGNLGIGTSSPSGKLNVVANGKFGQFTPSTTGTAGYLAFSSDSGFTTARSLIGVDNSSGNGLWSVGGAATALSIGTVDSFPIVFATGNTEKMRLDSSGNLGLGVTPSAGWSGKKALQVGVGACIYGDTSYGGQAVLGANIYSGTSGNIYYLTTAAASYYSQYAGVHYWFNAPSGTAGAIMSPTQAMTLDASGNLLVGDTANAFSARLQVRKDVATTNLLSVQNEITSGNVYGVISSVRSNGNNTSSYHFSGVTQGVNQWYLYGNGTSSFTSDQRKKKNIETTRDGYLEDLCSLRVVKYNWWTDEDGTPKELGLIAQEVEQVFPGLVTDAIHPDVDGQTYKVLKGSVIPFMLLKAIQELSAELNELKQKVNA